GRHPLLAGARLAAKTTDGMVRCSGMVSNKEDKRFSAHGPEPTVLTQQTRRQTACVHWTSVKFWRVVNAHPRASELQSDP
ncbi:hypothetical protein BHM03_00052732, partial [Ensete ventricosum]